MSRSDAFPADLMVMEESPLVGRSFGPGRAVAWNIGDVPGLVSAVALAAEVSEDVALNLTRELLEGGPIVVKVERGHRKLLVRASSGQGGGRDSAGASDG